MSACVEAGVIGIDLEKELLKFGVCFGHEPVINFFSRYIKKN